MIHKHAIDGMSKVPTAVCRAALLKQSFRMKSMREVPPGSSGLNKNELFHYEIFTKAVACLHFINEKFALSSAMYYHQWI